MGKASAQQIPFIFWLRKDKGLVISMIFNFVTWLITGHIHILQHL